MLLSFRVCDMIVVVGYIYTEDYKSIFGGSTAYNALRALSKDEPPIIT